MDLLPLSPNDIYLPGNAHEVFPKLVELVKQKLYAARCIWS